MRAAKSQGHCRARGAGFHLYHRAGGCGLRRGSACSYRCRPADDPRRRGAWGLGRLGCRTWRQRPLPLYMAVDGVAVAVIGVADPIKPGSPGAIAALHALGLKVAMITGDNRVTAAAIASTLGIDHVVAEVLPEGKVAALNSLREGGAKVPFVGDGINDAPALASADVGNAIETGTDVAVESADVVLMSGDLRGVVNAFRISQRSMANIRQNLFWAFGYNVVLIPVAAGVLYPLNGTLL
ncbi:HAD-IC family P-type ATPase [Cypionkella psychrotolerans]|uniref:HAD-IC family P-type ATPase n=1 Tax=Cypionkella psychrotolerans TaxID=1678131 RepID=UPI001F3E823A|nr:HAD-IC family P-type ATPase [Cypionkella psychrotolerans]